MFSVPRSLVIMALIGSLALAVPGHAQMSSPKAQPPAPARLSPAPDFSLESLYGETVHLSDFRGKVVLLYFWATWCGPCKIQMPWFVQLQNQYGPQGLQIVGISLDEDASREEIAEFVDSMHTNYPILIGNNKVAKAYSGVPLLPETVFIGADGRIQDRALGLHGKTETEAVIKKLLGIEPASGQTVRPVGEAAQAQK
jgi:peroxiredoxin